MIHIGCNDSTGYLCEFNLRSKNSEKISKNSRTLENVRFFILFSLETKIKVSDPSMS